MRTVFLLALAACAESEGEAPVVREPRFDEAEAALLAELDAEDNLATAASIAVCRGGEVLWRESFGPDVTSEHAFQIGSTTKQMTAALVLQQVQEGLYGLDDPLSELLPDFSLTMAPGFQQHATLRQLLSHQSGLSDHADWAGSADDDALAAWQDDIADSYLFTHVPAGTFFNYSNPGYTLAGLIVEEHDAEGRYLADILQQDLFDPLGMSSSFLRKDDLLASGVPYAPSTGVSLETYAYEPIPIEDVPDAASLRPAGLVWSTPSDLCAWGQFVMDGGHEEIPTPELSTLIYGDHYSYGLGMFVWDLWPMADGSFYPIRVWEHGGNTLSFTSHFVMLPDQDVVIALLSNGYIDRFSATVDEVIQAVVDPLPEPSDYEPEFDPSALGGQVGEYDSVYAGPFTISEGGEHGLQIAAPLLEQYGIPVGPDLVPHSTDFWFVDIAGTTFDLTFVRDEQGRVEYVRTRLFVGSKLDP